ncbi:MAG: hypothetical protein GY847_18445 [Proteobacteria bacterium]|nr:hypothetical protein [Pseudomonadota bacterium]
MTLAKTIITVALITVLVGCSEGASKDSFEFNENIQHIVVNVDFGELTLNAGRVRDGALVNAEVDCRTAAAEYDVYVEGNTLHVEMDTGNDASACEGAFEIIAPANVSIDARTARGNVIVEGIEGDVKAVSYKGNIELTDVAGDLEIAAVSGDVIGTNLRSAENTVTVGAGETALSFASTPRLVNVDTIMGNPILNVPGTNYRIDASTESGLVTMDGLHNLASAESTLLLTVESGDILIAAY